MCDLCTNYYIMLVFAVRREFITHVCQAQPHNDHHVDVPGLQDERSFLALFRHVYFLQFGATWPRPPPTCIKALVHALLADRCAPPPHSPVVVMKQLGYSNN